MSCEAWAADGEGASNSGEMESREIPPGLDPQRERILVARMAKKLRNTLSASANTFRQVPNALHEGSKPPPTDSFAASSLQHVVNHPNNLASAFLLENQHSFVHLPDNSSVTTIFNSYDLNQISPTTTQSYSPPVSFPQISIPVTSPQLESTGSEHQEMSTLPPHIVANFAQDIVVPDNAYPMISSTLAANNQQWINRSQYPPNPSSVASSEMGVVRTVRRTPHLQSTPFSRSKSKWPSFLKDGFVVCQWRDCGLSFYTSDAFQTHCQNDHKISGANGVKGQCYWRGCPPKIMGSLLRHIATHAGIRYFCPRRCGTKPTTRPRPDHICVPA